MVGEDSAAAAASAFALLAELSARDRGRLWGLPLDGPMLVVDRAEGHVFANCAGFTGAAELRPGLHRAPLPRDLPVANSAVVRDGVRWSMVSVPLPADPERLAALVAHEAWHRIQPELGFAGPSGVSAHFEQAEHRIALRLELRALAAALRDPGPDGCRHALAHAVAYRRRRRRLDGATAAAEAELEIHEGLAEYTGRVLGHADPGAAVAARLDAVAVTTPLVRTFAYLTGPAAGLVLDRLQPGWRDELRVGRTIDDLLAGAAGTGSGEPADDRYEEAAVTAEEQAAASERAAAQAHWREVLVHGPTARFSLVDGDLLFDPGQVVALGDAGSVYLHARAIGPWGSLRAHAGVLVDAGYQEARVALVDGLPAADLDLAPGWALVPDAAGAGLVCRADAPSL